MIAEYHARMQLAIELAPRHTRPSIVHDETGLPRDTLRALYRELHGVSAPSGQLPILGGAAINSRRLQLQASLFAVLYWRCLGQRRDTSAPRWRDSRIHAVMAAHDLGRELAGSIKSFDMTRCWVTARDLQIGTARLLGCRVCEAHFLVAEQSRFDRSCPICALYRNQSADLPMTRTDARDAFARSYVPPPMPCYRRWPGRLR